MNSKKSNRILAGIDFSLAAFDIYWGLSYGNPMSLVLAAFLIICGVGLLMGED